jgi:hypothetical protein
MSSLRVGVRLCVRLCVRLGRRVGLGKPYPPLIILLLAWILFGVRGLAYLTNAGPPCLASFPYSPALHAPPIPPHCDWPAGGFHPPIRRVEGKNRLTNAAASVRQSLGRAGMDVHDGYVFVLRMYRVYIAKNIQYPAAPRTYIVVT